MSGDMKSVIVPKSDQLNADDLISGPITIRVTGVAIKGSGEQPIAISFDGDNGKPYKPCKSMCRVMVAAWGADSKQYTGRSMTLYRDPTVKWGGMDVGGIRISHLSDIESAMTMALTMTRSNRKPFTVRPLSATTESAGRPNPPTSGLPPTDEGALADLIDEKQEGAMLDLLLANGVELRDFLAFAEVAKLTDLPAKYFAKACAWVKDANSVRTKPRRTA